MTEFKHWTVVYLSLSQHNDGHGIASITADGPFPSRDDAVAWEKSIRRVKGPGYIRPLADPAATIEALGRD